MAIISRQTGLLAAENWKKVYQTFREADFTTYDFETLRKSMIDYIKLYYPEDFNDFTESSEFIALIDLIAFLGQNLAFRTDLNARENFLDTAERRDSILKLAKLISYNPKRSIPASGFLKIDSVSTTENIFDSDGINLSNTTILWDDPANENWLEQFTTVVNASLVSNQMVGKPGNSQAINGIRNDEYSLNVLPSIVPVFRFETSIENRKTNFEIVSASSIGKSYVYEVPPDFSKPFNFLYRNDNNGNASNNTGYFFYFKQGELSSSDFVINEATPNKAVDINVNNINNTDVWLYSLNSNSTTKNLWTAVPSTAGINVIYNTVEERDLYQINTRAADQISLAFGDGSYSNIPQGNFRLYHRASNGFSYKITPEEMRSITVSFNYTSRDNRTETITFRAGLRYTVTNAAPRETTDDIKQKAPQQYYTQNRMITGEDYNILPYTSFSKIVKSKSINRTSAGLSRYLDVLDTTGKYSSTNIFGQDGVLYRTEYVRSFNFKFNNTNDIQKVLYNNVINDILASKEMMHYYYSNVESIPPLSSVVSAGTFIVGRYYLITSIGLTDFTTLGAAENKVGIYFQATAAGTDFGVGSGTALEAPLWNLSTTGNNSATGYFIRNNAPLSVSMSSTTNTRYIRPGAVLKFAAPPGYYFNASNTLVPGKPRTSSDRINFYAAVMQVYGDGTNNGIGNFTNGSGPVVLNSIVPTGALLETIVPVYKNNFSSGYVLTMSGRVAGYENFGLYYDGTSQSWGFVNDLSQDWMVKFEFRNNINDYLVTYRGIEFVFHSPIETTFYFDKSLKIYDSKTATVIKDQVKVLKSNSKPDSSEALGNDCTWHVYKQVVDNDGYVDNTRIYVTYADSDDDGVPDDPTVFEYLVNPALNGAFKKIFFRSVATTGYNKFFNLVLVEDGAILSQYANKAALLNNKDSLEVGQIFYAHDENAFYTIGQDDSGKTIVGPLERYAAYTGRRDLYYQYRHNIPNTRRVDPNISNIIDVYMLTSEYNESYRLWIADTTNTIVEPNMPTSNELALEFSELNNIKAISDSIVFHSASYKPIFGDKATNNLQATFKVVKNPNLNISDADIKTSVVNAINTYFDITNWDFGESFYFSELAAYLHKVLSPNIASIIIVPKDSTISFGNLQQINSEPNEIIISAATVDNVEIITAITASQINQGLVTVK
jgi:hypothetical protein